jgi:hypothetical protein
MSFYVVVFSVIVAFFAYLPFLNSTSAANIKNAGAFLNSLDASEIEVFTLQAKNHDVKPAVSVPILDLFTKKKIVYHCDKDFSPQLMDFEKSPLRFTWEYKNPKYYIGGNAKEDADLKKAVVVITESSEQPIPPEVEQKIKGYRNAEIFKISEGVFKYQTIVRVYYNYN